MKKIILIPFLVLLFTAPFISSNAIVLVEDVESSTALGFPPFNENFIDTGSGFPGDYALIGCATTAQGPNSFNLPAPGAWTELDNGTCGGSGLCIQGIWGKAIDTASGDLITCSWTDAQSVFAAGSFRYTGVDQNNPVIDIACNSGTGNIATAPSITTEALSQVARIYTGSRLTQVDPTNSPETFLNALFLGVAIFEGPSNVFIQGETEFAPVAGETGEATLDLALVGAPFVAPIDFSPGDWRACTIGIRMQTRVIPTMSEWGFLAFAAALGIAGIFVLRRRQAVKA